MAKAGRPTRYEGGTSLGDGRWVVEKLLEQRVSQGVTAGDVFRKGTQLYKVRWAGCSEAEDSWEPKSSIAQQLVQAFHDAESQQPPAPPGSPKDSKRPRVPGAACSPSAQSPASKRT